MVLILTALLIGVTLDLTGAKPAIKYYASKYDHIDVEAILNNRRMVKYYSSCLLSKGPCPPEGIEFKRILPEALQTNCGRCTEKQATVTLRAIGRLKKEYPKIWSQLAEKWDPDDVYVAKFESTFGTKTGPPKAVKPPPLIVNRFDAGEDEQPTDNSIDGNLATTISQQDLTTQIIITSTNRDTSSTIKSTSTIIDFPYEPSSSTASSTVSSTTITSTTTIGVASISTTSTILPPIPGLLPINTFFTNPPIPIRPIVNLNIGANIGATVKAIKQVEKIVAGIALEKIGMIRSMFLRPWRRTRIKYS